jgi:hypothetical protein
MTVSLATASYRSFVPRMGVPVQTSLGRPKYGLPYELVEELHALKPWGLFGTDMADDEFERKYRARLDKTGTSKLWRVFHAISRKHDGARLVLLCHEDVLGRQQSCHRSMFSRWWAEQTGHAVPELSWLMREDGTAVVVWESTDRRSAA